MQVKVYGIDNCRYCEKTKVLLERAGVPFEYIHVEERKKSEVMDWMVSEHMSPERTFPRVLTAALDREVLFELVGGYTETLDYLLNGGFDAARFSKENAA